MPGGSAALAAGALALALALAGPAAAPSGSVACGGVAPFDTSCLEGPFVLGGPPDLGASAGPGFVGELKACLQQGYQALCIQCSGYGVAICGPPEGYVLVGWPTVLTCATAPHDAPVWAGPVGAYGCTAHW